jgi:CSLREA domain-containing protein
MSPWTRVRLTGGIAFALLLASVASAGATTITVNSTGDAAANDGACTLREAITSANGNAASGGMVSECAAGQAAPTQDAIVFSLAGAGPHTIAVMTALPAITETVSVDATAEPDEVRVDNAAAVITGFDVEADDVEIRDLTMTRFNTTLDLVGTDGAEIEDDIIGTDQAGTASLGGGAAVRAGTPGTNGETTGATINSNVIAAQTSYGIQVANDLSNDITIQGNRIGTTPAGTAALPNEIGVRVISGADDITIGGAGLGEGNLVSGNTSRGIEVSNATGTDPNTGITIQGNRVGTGIAGEAAVPNGAGILIHGDVNGAVVRNNLVSGNTDEGISVNGTASAGTDPTGTTIAGNLIGTDDDGNEDLGNGDNAILLSGSAPTDEIKGTVIGGTTGLTPGGACTGDCNLIAANADQLTEPAVAIAAGDISGTQIMGNHIGTDVSGMVPLGNFGVGLSVNGSGAVTIGSPAAPNVIADNGADGVHFDGTDGVAFEGNLVGVGSDGTTAMGNATGVVLRAGTTGAAVGGTGAGEGNTIANNTNSGVRVEDVSTTANPILGNSIYANGSLGIDLFGQIGADTNDPLDADTGPNDGQNYPALTAAVAGGSTAVTGTLASEPDNDYRIEVFANDVPDISGHGQGKSFLGAFTVTTDSSGEAGFGHVVDGDADPGDYISSTATELNGQGEPRSTSEFSANITQGCDVVGTPDDDDLTGLGSSDDIICGLGGDDEIAPDGGADVIVGGDGKDKLDLSDATGAAELELNGAGTVNGDPVGTVEMEDVTGTDKADTITGDDEKNTLKGGKGKDTIEAGGGGDTLDGGDGDDTLKGQDRADTLKGKDGDDDLRGGDGADTLKGGEGKKDDLDGGDGEDSLDGGDGSKDVCDGGNGHDERHAPGCETKKSLP